jgi:hypothetical protein
VPFLKDFAAMHFVPSEFGKFLVAETEKWAKVIHEANLKLME